MIVEIKRGNDFELVQTSHNFIPFNFKTCKKVGHDIEYITCPAFLDTETSHNHNRENPLGWVYQWCFEFHNQIFVGRTPNELIVILKIILSYLTDNQRLVCYIHNLSYDHQYLYQFLRELGEPNILAVKSHKILTATYGKLELRCSWLMSNMSLYDWGVKMNCHIIKIKNGIDYEEIRYQDSELTATDWEYMLTDVLALKECVRAEFIYNKDNVATTPLTSTGYVRRDCRKAVSHDKAYRDWFTKTALCYDCFELLQFGFMGGYTHGNRFFSGVTVPNVGHFDKKSHYPWQQQGKYFPMGKFEHYGVGKIPLSDFCRLCKKYCVVATVGFTNLKLKNGVTAPFISKSKIMNFYECDFRNEWGAIATDNGRVINCDGTAYTAVTELDFEIYDSQYNYDNIIICDVWISERGKFPQQILKVINDYFIVKETLQDGIYRMKSKNKLNGIYGMTATNPVRDEYIFNMDLLDWTVKENTREEAEEKLKKFYKSRNSFMNYALGVWTTAHARYEIYDLIKNYVGYENFIYADTDSIFFKDNATARDNIRKYNEDIIKQNKKLGLGVNNIKGGISYYGTFEEEDFCKEFRFLHAKCYAYTKDEIKENVSRETLKVTIAGVAKDNKQLDNERVTSADELECLDNLIDGFTFRECGGTTSLYMDGPIKVENIDGHSVILASACMIFKSDKQIGGTIYGYYESEEECE